MFPFTVCFWQTSMYLGMHLYITFFIFRFCYCFLNKKSLITSDLRCSSVLRKTPIAKVMAPENMATHENSHRPWARRTLFWKGNFTFNNTMLHRKKCRIKEREKFRLQKRNLIEVMQYQYPAQQIISHSQVNYHSFIRFC